MMRTNSLAMVRCAQELPPNDRLEWVRLNVSDKAQVRELLDRFGPRLAAVIYCAVPKHQGT